MDEDVPRQLEFGRHQQGGPVDRVEAQDVLADEVIVRRPELAREILTARVGERGVVVQQRVEPHVEDVLAVPRHAHAPGEFVPRQGNVAQPRADERQRLVVARARRDEVLALGVQLEQALLKGGQGEEVVLLLLPRQLDVVNRAAVARVDLGLRLEVGTARAVPALVGPLVHEAVVPHARQHPLHAGFVLAVGGADEEIVAGADLRRQRLEALGVAVG